MKEQARNQKEIALAIQKNKSVISREFKRNSDKRNEVYKPELAHEKYLNKLRTIPIKIKFIDEIKNYVTNKLNH